MTYQDRKLPPSDPQSPDYEQWVAACARNVAAQRRTAAYARSGAMDRLQAYAERHNIPYEEALARVHQRDAQERAYSQEAHEQYLAAIRAQIEADESIRRAYGLYDASDPANNRKHVSWSEARQQEAEEADLARERQQQRQRQQQQPNSNGLWEIKSAPITGLEVKMVNGIARLRGYASVFHNVDLTDDIVMPGAYKDTLAEAKSRGRSVLYPILYQHDPNRPIGGIVEAREDVKGLAVEGILATDTADGATAYSLVSKGILSGLSIGYRVTRSDHDSAGHRRLKAVKLHEVSLVMAPANTLASVDHIGA